MTQRVTSKKRQNRTEVQIELAQYFTPNQIADYMAKMFDILPGSHPNILDPGAGEGILGLTLCDNFKTEDFNATFIEYDTPTFQVLKENTEIISSNHSIELINGDFIEEALRLERENQEFSHVILNPPYFKLRVDSPSSKVLRRNGIQITNIYAAFVWLSLRLLEDDGQLVAIIPRSFCNGPYFLSFREYMIDNFSIDNIHIFSSRNKAFSKDSVLQENIIIKLSKREQSDKVKVTYSTDQSFIDIETKNIPFDVIVEPNDTSRTIHIPSINQTRSLSEYVGGGLEDIGLSVSTGPVVDFRLKANIHSNHTKGSVPLLYPSHMSGHVTDWPLIKFNKSGQYYKALSDPKTMLELENIEPVSPDRNILPLDGYYVIVRRFSSKEEKRRIFSAVVSPERFKSNAITFENHLNYFHIKKHGFDKDLAYGLCAYLNSSILDEHFRKISGHTQVNVSDLKRLPYPSKNQLVKLGQIMQSIDSLIDDIVTRELLGNTEYERSNQN